ncbi:MAG: type II secretion system-associated lipoprotein [Spirochaetia bacterium]|nr:type II secretion system-associated lipoprotein [Spirochaetia bacterium]
MKKIQFSALCLILIFSVTSCIKKVLTEESLSVKNKEISGFIFTAKADIYPHFIENPETEPEKLLQRGERVHLIIEVSHDWARVKAYDEKSKRQHAVGKTVIYIFKKDLIKGKKPEEMIDRYIETMFLKSPVK